MQENLSLAIEVRNLTKNYGNSLALSNVSFEVKRGEIFGFLGPNGAGKTTTIAILTTLLKPTSGSASIFREDVLKNVHRVRKDIALVLQANSIDPFLNVYDNLYFFGLLQKMPKKEIKSRIEEILEVLDLSSKRRASIFELSGGLFRRLQIARVFLTEAKLLFLDEPTLGIDIEGKINIWDLLKRKCQDKNLTVFLATNDIAEAEALCDRIAFISQGKLLAVDTPDALKQEIKRMLLIVELDSKYVPVLNLNLPMGASLLVMESNRIEISLKQIDSNLSSILAQITQQASIKDIDLRKPSIQDVFLNLMKNNSGK
jgi:ABC-2 type transport system ATP-binding protein